MTTAQKPPYHQTIVFVGNPNSGKTTLFNALTGAHQATGNFCGVTVDWVAAECTLETSKIKCIDLPGIYTFAQSPQAGGEDEQITRQFLAEKSYDVIVNVVDAAHLERNLYLTMQCLELGIPMIVALTRTDLAQKQDLQYCAVRLQKSLGCPVVAVSSKTNTGLDELKEILFQKISPPHFEFKYPEPIEKKIQTLQKAPYALSRVQALRTLEGEPSRTTPLEPIIQQKPDWDVGLASARYEWIESILPRIILQSASTDLPKKSVKKTLTQRIDAWVCHRFWGLPCFLLAMYGLFFFAMNIGGAFQDAIEQMTTVLFIEGVGEGLRALSLPAWVVAAFQGVGHGVSTVLTFAPVIGAMFIALVFLESSGYMARAALVMDRWMQFLGLPGKSFVPMIIGFGCNVPAILGTRTLENKRDRILTVMMSPFMSCGARLAIFTVFVSIFFPKNGQNVVFGLYLIGILMAVFTGLLLKKTLLSGAASPLIMEMPEYTLPTLKTLMRSAYFRLKRFLVNATKLIIPICMIMGIFNAVVIEQKSPESEPKTLLSVMGKSMTPIFAPMGLTEDNWPATVSLFTGILAKEVVIGSLNTLYDQTALEDETPPKISYTKEILGALRTIPENLATLRGALSNPIAAKAPVETLGKRSHAEMQKRFVSAQAAFAYLLFVLLYFPCVSATAAMVKEVQRGWTVFSVCWTTGLAYCIAVFYYQWVTWVKHPIGSSLWCFGILIFLMGTIWAIHRVSRVKLQRALPTQIVYSG